MKKFLLFAAAWISFMAAAATASYEIYAAEILMDLSAGSGKRIYAASVYETTESIFDLLTRNQQSEPEEAALMAGAGMAIPEVNDTDDMSMTLISFSAEESEETAVSGDSAEDELEGLCVADVTNSMNVRLDPSEDSELAGYLYKDNVAKILEQADGWSRISSGKLTGWAKNEYLLFEDEAKSRIREINLKTATVNTETLRVREEDDEESDINALLAEGTEVDVLDAGDEWTKIRYDDGTEGTGEGYVSNEYITIGYRFSEGETIEEVKDREEKSAAKKAEAAKAKEEKKKKEQEAAPAPAAESAEAPAPEPAVVDNGAMEATVDDETLLAALIQCECGQQPYEGQLAVGAVVMNRARFSYGSIRNAIYAPNQFGPASSGKLAKTLLSGAISGTARQAARDAISGLSNIGVATHFRNVRSGHAGIVIGSHVFW